MKRIFQSEKKKFEKAIHGCDEGYIICESCRTKIIFADCTPLSMEKCPKCQDLIFIPIEIEGWWVMEPLGAGGFGSVYLARAKENPKNRAAVKILQRSEQVDQYVFDEFRRESEISYSFERHPHLPETYAYGSLGEDNAFIIMEFLDGTRLSDYIASRESSIPPEECLYYTLDLINALEYIYNKGYVYRDMKPENVIIKNDGLAAVIDYGLCLSHEDAANVGDGPVIGSALFMPPERYLRSGEDHRGDIYSLGMLLYFALMGDTFFSRTEVRTVARGHMRRLRIETRSRMRDNDADMVDLVDHMIRRDREERIQTYDEVRYAIFSVLGHLHEIKTTDPWILRRRQHFIKTYGKIEYE